MIFYYILIIQAIFLLDYRQLLLPSLLFFVGYIYSICLFVCLRMKQWGNGITNKRGYGSRKLTGLKTTSKESKHFSEITEFSWTLQTYLTIWQTCLKIWLTIWQTWIWQRRKDSVSFDLASSEEGVKSYFHPGNIVFYKNVLTDQTHVYLSIYVWGIWFSHPELLAFCIFV